MAMDGSIFFAVVALILGFLLRLWNATRYALPKCCISCSSSSFLTSVRACSHQPWVQG